MAKPKANAGTEVIQKNAAIPVPFTYEEFKVDILETFLFYVRSIGWITNPETAWKLTGAPSDGNDSELLAVESAAYLGLEYQHIQATQFATVLTSLYQYAYFGRQDMSQGEMGGETIYNWIAALLEDAESGAMASEWAGFDYRSQDSARRCGQVAELANARSVLEGGEGFYAYFQRGKKSGESSREGELTVRQMAILAGMEEMSIRAAANPKRPSPLKTHSSHGSTRIAIEVAKEWLKSKGRYVPVTRHWTDGEIDLAKQRFACIPDLSNAIEARFKNLAASTSDMGVEKAAKALGLEVYVGFEGQSTIQLDWDRLKDEAYVSTVATAVNLPPQILWLRVRETLAVEELARVTKALRSLTEESINPAD